MDVLAVLLMIGKGILALLLVLVVLILLLLAVVLFASFFYQIEASKGEDVAAKVSLRWLFGALALTAVYENGEMTPKVFLFGRTMEEWAERKKKKKQKKKKKKQKKKKQKKKQSQKQSSKQKGTASSAQVKEQASSLPKKEEKEAENKNNKENNTPSQKPPIPAAKQGPTAATVKPASPPPVMETITPRVKRIPMEKVELEKEVQEPKNKVKDEKANEKRAAEGKKVSAKQEAKKKAKDSQKEEEAPVPSLQWFLSLSFGEKKELVQIGLSFLRRIVVIVRPKTCRIYGTVGTGDPYTTGELLAALAVVKGLVLSEIYVTGVFDQAVVEGELCLSGRLRLISIGKETVWLATRPPIRRIIKQIWKGRGEGK